jgi:hypothetical protein
MPVIFVKAPRTGVRAVQRKYGATEITEDSENRLAMGEVSYLLSELCGLGGHAVRR